MYAYTHTQMQTPMYLSVLVWRCMDVSPHERPVHYTVMRVCVCVRVYMYVCIYLYAHAKCTYFNMNIYLCGYVFVYL